MVAAMDALSWNRLVAGLPGAHILQTWEWGQVKERYGWQTNPKVWEGPGGEPEAAALVLSRGLHLRGLNTRLKVLYVPKGPLLGDWNETAQVERVLSDLRKLAMQQAAIFIKIDPEVRLGSGVLGEAGSGEDPQGGLVTSWLAAHGWQPSPEQIQFRNTVLISLDAPEEQLLERMKQKTRYNLRLAGRKGVQVRPGNQSDLSTLYRMYAETSLRDGFAIREEGYYRTVWERFMQVGLAEPLIAEVEGEPVAAIVVFRFAGKAWYLYGMSRAGHRDKMPNHALQWEAIRRAKAAGCSTYDMWGAPEVFDPGDPLWGVYRFKEGWGGQVVRHIGAWDLPVRPGAYRLYMEVLPRVLERMRRRGARRTQAGLEM
jgi:lipid II:glycine glycyltransferase (peptidoglycan interpeptide bridge formation enzyme)